MRGSSSRTSSTASIPVTTTTLAGEESSSSGAHNKHHHHNRSHPPTPRLEEFREHYIDVRIPVSPNVSLEGVLRIPDPEKTLTVNKVAICSHPWSRLGGSMEDPVLDAVSNEFLKRNYHVVLFNSRGVGASAGHATWAGCQEGQDLQKVIEWALNEILNVDTAVLLGYSYGSLITSYCPSPKKLFPDRIRRSSHILLSSPLGVANWITFFNCHKFEKALDALLVDPTANVLAIYGSRDQWTGVKRYGEWVDHALEVRAKAGFKDTRPPLTSHSSSSSGDSITQKPEAVRRLSKESISRAPSPSHHRTHGEYAAKCIHHADHFWRGHHIEHVRNVVRHWVQRLDAGVFDVSED